MPIAHASPDGKSIALVVADSASPDARDTAWKTWLEARDFISNVTYEDIDAVTQAGLEAYDAVFMCYSTGSSPRVETVVKPANVGVMFVNRKSYDTMKFGTGHNYARSQTQVNITDNTHFMTSPYPIGPLTYQDSYYESWISGWSQDVKDLGQIVGQPTQASILVLDKGEKYIDESIAVERRLFSGLGYYDPTKLNSDGITLTERGLKWVLHMDVEVPPDTTPPVWSNAGTNNTVAGEPTLFHVKWSDNVGLSGFIFGTNNTGTWVNDTWTPMSGTTDWSNITKILNSAVGVTVQWRIWANDTSNNWGDTGILSLTTASHGVNPVASFTYSPAYPSINETVTFNASASYDPDGCITSYRWNFGDGNITTVNDPIITHIYTVGNSTINYTVTLTVTDNEGLTNSTTDTVTTINPDVLRVSLPAGTYVDDNEDPWLSECWLLNVTGVSGTFTVRINNTSGCVKSYDTHLIIALNDAAYNNLVNLTVNAITIPKSAFKNGKPKPYNLRDWPSGDVYPTWFNDTLVNVGIIDKKGYTDVTVSVTFSNATGVRMHFDAYGSKYSCPPTKWWQKCHITYNPLSGDSTVLFWPPPPPPLSVSISPTSVAMNLGQYVTFTSTVSGGTPPYSYQWFLNDTAVPGANASSWTFTPNSTGFYTVYLNVTDSVGVTAKSNIASVTVNPPLSVWISPTSVTLDLGQSKTFNSTVSGGTSPYCYQWFLNDTAVPGANASSWTFTPPSAGFYTVYLNVTDSSSDNNNNNNNDNCKGVTVKSNIANVTVNPALTVSISPTNVVIDLGQSVTFDSTVAGGTSPYFYQWYLNGTPVSGATNPDWTFTPTSAGFYTVYLNVSDSADVDPWATSNIANVTVNPQLTVSISPSSATITLGQSVLFNSAVSGGTPPYSYQWYLNGAPVSGATSASWTFTPTSAGSYSVYVNVTDNVGVTAQSNTASVTVNPAISVSITPTSVVMDVGQSKTFTSSVSGGTQPYTYQWYLNGTPVGTNSSSWTFTPTSIGSYTVYLNVTDNAGAKAQSNTVPVTVNPWPTVSITPTSVVMDMGQSVTFTSTVSGGTPPYTYQWYLNDAPVTGATSPNWTFTPTSPGSYTVYVNVTDSGDPTVKSNVASVTVNPPLSVSISPNSVTMDVGQSQTFTSSVSGGTSPYSYQWYLNGAPISGATSPSWTFTPTSSGSYTVYVNVTDNVGATAKSNVASVTVNPELSASISPTSVVMNVGQSQTFTSSVSGGTQPYSYQWYLDGTPVGINSSSWTFTPLSAGYYLVHLNVTDSVSVTAKSNTASVTVSAAFYVSVAPTSLAMDVGESKTFSSTVLGGTPPYTYQWYLNGTPVGTNSSSWTFTPGSVGSYTVYLNVTDKTGAEVQSNIVPVTVNPWPTVTISPTSVVMDVGQSQTFTSTVSGGTPPYTYQWYLNGTPVGVNSSSWTFTPVDPGVYTVYVNVTDSGDPTVKSNVASVTVNPPLSVSISPTSVTMNVGDSQLFTSSVSGGTSPYTYQWYLDDNPVSGATSSSWTFTPASSGSYSVYVNVTDNVGVTAQSNIASVTVNPEFSVSISPTSVEMDVGESKTFTSSVSGGTPPYTYQWYRDGTPVGTNSSTWAFTPTSAGSYTVYVNVTDNVGVTAQSNIASVTVNPELSVYISPTSVEIYVGQSVEFTALADGGTPPYTYQWYVNDQPYPGATESSWTFTPTDPGDYTIYVMVTDSSDPTVKSNTASAKVNPTLPPPVGGYAAPIDIATGKEVSHLLASQIGLAFALIAAISATIILVKRRKKTLKREH